MESTGTTENPIIQINSGIIGPRTPREVSVKVKKLKDYPEISASILDVVKNFSSIKLAGPPVCDELVELIAHMFTEEEASLFRHIPPLPASKSVKAIAAKEHRSLQDVSQILDNMANKKKYMLCRGDGLKAKYSMIPLFPGVMEQIMFRNSLDDLTDWHKKFASLFDTLYKTGYTSLYNKYKTDLVRYLPIEQSIDSQPMAWPSDRLEEIFDQYNDFAVTYCQCRTTEHLLDRNCDRPMETCVFMGKFTKKLIEKGKIRKAEKKEVLEIKREAEASGLVTWMTNARGGSPLNVSCSCCGCCCYMMRIVTEFNMPSLIAPPHFIPKFDASKCVSCGKCATACTMGAITVDTLGKHHVYKSERCVGCGHCTRACNAQHAIEMVPAPNGKKPPRNVISLLAKSLPNTLRNARYMHKFQKGMR